MERVVEALGGELPASVLYGLLKLRAEVFVVEQGCAYLDPDGRDLEPSTRHLWVEGDDGSIVAALRVLASGDDGCSIGRVVTAPAHRSRGLAGELVRIALDGAPRPVRLNAQAHLADWYGRFGFTPAGDEFLDDGIPHLPMVLLTAPAGGRA